MTDLLAEVESRGKAAYVQELFGGVADKYDRTSAMLSWGMLPWWRRQLLREVPAAAGGRLLDVATGTGALPLGLRRRSDPPSSIVGVDFCRPMLEVARRRSAAAAAPAIRLVQGDALELPFPSDAFDVVTISFALRNFTDPLKAFAELVRVTRPGGTVASIDIGRPRAWWVRAPHALCFGLVTPLLDRLGTRGGGAVRRYRFIEQSYRYVPSAAEQAGLLSRLGLEDVRWRELTGGLVLLLRGTKAGGVASGGG